jgi:hypothetical protein
MPSRKLFTEKAPTARASVKPGREARLKFRSLRRERHTILLTIRRVIPMLSYLLWCRVFKNVTRQRGSGGMLAIDLETGYLHTTKVIPPLHQLSGILPIISARTCDDVSLAVLEVLT